MRVREQVWPVAAFKLACVVGFRGRVKVRVRVRVRVKVRVRAGGAVPGLGLG